LRAKKRAVAVRNAHWKKSPHNGTNILSGNEKNKNVLARKAICN
jgi:hypothetical protein